MHQNSSLVPDDKKSFLTEQVNDFAKELLKITSIPKDLKKFFFEQIDKEYPEEKVQSVTAPIQKVDVNSTKPSFWQRLFGPASSPNIKVVANQEYSANKSEIQNSRSLFF